MENITVFISNIASELIAALLGSIIMSQFIRVRNNKKNNNQSAKPTKSDNAFLVLRYFTMLTTILLALFFLEFNKWFVFFISAIFSITVIMLIYDYFIYTLSSIVSNQEKEENEKEKNLLLYELTSLDTNKTEDYERFKQIKIRLVDLMKN